MRIGLHPLNSLIDAQNARCCVSHLSNAQYVVSGLDTARLTGYSDGTAIRGGVGNACIQEDRTREAPSAFSAINATPPWSRKEARAKARSCATAQALAAKIALSMAVRYRLNVNDETENV